MTYLSIIVPIYNVEEYLEQCLASIVFSAQMYQERIEVILIDDGSKDSSGEIADWYAQEYSYIQVIHKENAGVAAARNTGIETASGEWLYFVDADDWLTEHAVGSILGRICTHGSDDMILFDAIQNNGKQEKRWEHFAQEHTWKSADELHRLQCGMLYYPIAFRNHKVPLAAPWDKIYRRKFMEENNIRFRESLMVLDDMVFNVEALGRAKRVSYCKDILYHYRYVPDSITNTYKPDRIRQDCKVWAYLGGYFKEYGKQAKWDNGERQLAAQAFYCRIIKSFSICCRLCFFNPQNQRSLEEKLRYVKKVLHMEPYRRAFERVGFFHAEWRLQLVILMVRAGWIKGIYFLHLLQNGIGKRL